MPKLRKDKINAAVYAAMEETTKHPYVKKTLNQSDTPALETHRKGYDMDYMKMEHRLHDFFTTYWKDRLPQLREKLGRSRDHDAEERMKKIFYCKGIAYSTKHSHQCHHPLCPMCHHRKHYTVLKDLKPYLNEKDNDLYLIGESKFVPFDMIDMAMIGLEQKAKKITRIFSPLVEQWVRVPRIRWNEEKELFQVSYIVIMVGKKTNETKIMMSVFKHAPCDPLGVRKPATPKIMEPLLAQLLAYDPLLLKYGGIHAMDLWERQSPLFRYWSKHAHRVGSRSAAKAA